MDETKKRWETFIATNKVNNHIPSHGTYLHGVTGTRFSMITFPYDTIMTVPQFFHINMIIQSHISQCIRNHDGRSTTVMTTNWRTIRVGTKCMSRFVHFQFIGVFLVAAVVDIVMNVILWRYFFFFFFGFCGCCCCIYWSHNCHFFPGGRNGWFYHSVFCTTTLRFGKIKRKKEIHTE